MTKVHVFSLRHALTTLLAHLASSMLNYLNYLWHRFNKVLETFL